MELEFFINFSKSFSFRRKLLSPMLCPVLQNVTKIFQGIAFQTFFDYIFYTDMVKDIMRVFDRKKELMQYELVHFRDEKIFFAEQMQKITEYKNPKINSDC